VKQEDGRRGLRVAEIARAELARAAHRRLDDPGLANFTITSMKVSDDLQVIDVGVRFTGQPDTEQKKLLTRLRRALPRLLREVVPRLGLRRAPEFRLHYDTSIDAVERVDALLSEIAAENKKS
jgi:ribosome-binding factor A